MIQFEKEHFKTNNNKVVSAHADLQVKQPSEREKSREAIKTMMQEKMRDKMSKLI